MKNFNIWLQENQSDPLYRELERHFLALVSSKPPQLDAVKQEVLADVTNYLNIIIQKYMEHNF